LQDYGALKKLLPKWLRVSVDAVLANLQAFPR
jgi:hypothetical protein